VHDRVESGETIPWSELRHEHVTTRKKLFLDMFGPDGMPKPLPAKHIEEVSRSALACVVTSSEAKTVDRAPKTMHGWDRYRGRVGVWDRTVGDWIVPPP
jgi:hypothetical protein